MHGDEHNVYTYVHVQRLVFWLDAGMHTKLQLILQILRVVSPLRF